MHFEILSLFLGGLYNHFTPFYIAMVVVAVIVMVIGGYFMIRKKKYGKWVGLVGLLLLINPTIYFLFR